MNRLDRDIDFTIPTPHALMNPVREQTPIVAIRVHAYPCVSDAEFGVHADVVYLAFHGEDGEPMARVEMDAMDLEAIIARWREETAK